MGCTEAPTQIAVGVCPLVSSYSLSPFPLPLLSHPRAPHRAKPRIIVASPPEAIRDAGRVGEDLERPLTPAELLPAADPWTVMLGLVRRLGRVRSVQSGPGRCREALNSAGGRPEGVQGDVAVPPVDGYAARVLPEGGAAVDNRHGRMMEILIGL